MPTVTATYPVVDGSLVSVDVFIGDGQTGGSAVFLGEEEVASGAEVVDQALRDGAEIRGMVLVVSTTVVDIRPEHDHTSVRVILHGGLPDEFPIVQSATVRPGGAINYLTVVTFV